MVGATSMREAGTLTRVSAEPGDGVPERRLHGTSGLVRFAGAVLHVGPEAPYESSLCDEEAVFREGSRLVPGCPHRLGQRPVLVTEYREHAAHLVRLEVEAREKAHVRGQRLRSRSDRVLE